MYSALIRCLEIEHMMITHDVRTMYMRACIDTSWYCFAYIFLCNIDVQYILLHIHIIITHIYSLAWRCSRAEAYEEAKRSPKNIFHGVLPISL